jgi:hypothetical protein
MDPTHHGHRFGGLQEHELLTDNATAPKEEEDFGEEDPNADKPMEEARFDEESTTGWRAEGGVFANIKVNIEWDYEEVENSNWAPMACTHCQAMEMLVQALKSTSRMSSKERREMEQWWREWHGPLDIKARAALLDLVNKHGSLAEAVSSMCSAGDLFNEELGTIGEDMTTFQEDVEQYATAANLLNSTILQVVTKMREMSNSRHADVKARLAQVQAVTRVFGQPRPPSPPRPHSNPHQAFAGVQEITGDTPLGVATIGGSEVVISANYLFGMLQDLQVKIDVLTERSKNTGMIFGELAFTSESEFALWMTSVNPSGSDLAGFADLISIWVFAACNSSIDTATWLNEDRRAKSVGLKGSNADAMNAHLRSRRYPSSFTGKDSVVILSMTTIKMLESYKAWCGTIMGGGQKERLTSDLLMAVSCHRQYCLDYIPEGVLRDTAIKSAEFTMHFWNALTAYIEDEYTLLLSFKLLPKHVLLLLSNQVIQICDDMFEFCNCANNVDLQNPLAAVTFYS